MASHIPELPFATVDLDRQRRCGFPEVVYAEGKTPEWVEGILRRLTENGQDAFATEDGFVGRLDHGQVAPVNDDGSVKW